jgi:hypothetical protein
MLGVPAVCDATHLVSSFFMEFHQQKCCKENRFRHVRTRKVEMFGQEQEVQISLMGF